MPYPMYLAGFSLWTAFAVLTCAQALGTKKCAQEDATKTTGAHQPNPHSWLFAELSVSELATIRDYMKVQSAVNLSQSAFKHPSGDHIFSIELRVPRKREALLYMDAGGEPPPREATVVVFSGTQRKVVEYAVGPLPKPTVHRDITLLNYGHYPHFNARTVTREEYQLLLQHLFTQELPKARQVLQESFGPEKSYFFNDVVPRGFRSGDRSTWFSFLRNKAGFYLHPLGLDVLLDHSDTNSTKWRLLKVLYNGQLFNSMEELRAQYEAGNVTRILYQDRADYATLKPHRKPTGSPPVQTEPKGRRYSIQNNWVTYLDWSFTFGVSTLTGMRLFDVRFRGERIAYEISVQEAASFYGSNSAATMLTKFLDSGYGMGRFTHELVRGVDCPYLATYLDSSRFIDTEEPETFRNSLCIFEHNQGRPLRRHFEHYFLSNYGGLASSVLIVRTITSIGNYDFVWDFMFYQNGAMEARVFPTGYIYSVHLTEGGLEYGHQVAEDVLGMIHTHFVNFKVDLDIAGTNNYFLTKDMAYHEVQVPWSPERRVQVPKLVEKQLKTENEAALRFDQKIPRYLHIASNKTNKWGHNRSYRIQVLSFNGDHLPESVPEEAAVSWARYKVAITKHKDHESTSSSLYNQNDMWSPAVNFSSYINGESIENEDLVAWISTGFLHIPHAEDIPNTVTAGNGGGFFLRPHNYFDEDPSINSPDSVYLDPSIPSDSCELNPNACLQNEVCMPNLPAFTYNGFDEVIHI
ncbi:retina-specific copper amine oxidase isoform X3 [Erpetoichthys calabaricus]|uniref:Amine oxidase n=1 Tax=Erpetoichthys calabaricus TaxID=27687 RepID=A0A8C4T9U1_ERPCA|nr:retina-specific copper amine oxidase isoform X3 [Erpetoichthys calabaricus]